jgi:hypothetical protein
MKSPQKRKTDENVALVIADPFSKKNLGRGSSFNVSYQNCCKKHIYVNDSQNLAFATSHFVIEFILELLPFLHHLLPFWSYCPFFIKIVKF